MIYNDENISHTCSARPAIGPYHPATLSLSTVNNRLYLPTVSPMCRQLNYQSVLHCKLSSSPNSNSFIHDTKLSVVLQSTTHSVEQSAR